MYFPIIDALKENFTAKIPSIVTKWLTDNVDPVGSAVVVDKSLSISGAASDAKITGDKLNDLKSDLNLVTQLEELPSTNVYGKWSNGVFLEAESPYTKEFVVNAFSKITLETHADQYCDMYVFLDKDRNVLSHKIGDGDYTDTGKIIEILAPDNAYYLDSSVERTSIIDSIVAFAKHPSTYVTPEMFGAVGDGLSNDREALYEAIQSGKPVYLKNTYLIDDGFNIENIDRLVLYGYGTIHLKTDTYDILNPTILNVLQIDEIVVDGIRFVYEVTSATNDNSYANVGYYYHLRVINCNHAIITHCRFVDKKGNPRTKDGSKTFYGVVSFGSYGNVTKNIHITNNEITGATGRVIYINNSKDVEIIGNIVDVSTNSSWYRDSESVLMGFRLLSVSNTIVSSNSLSGTVRYSTPSPNSFYAYAFVLASSQVSEGVSPIASKVLITDNIVDIDGYVNALEVLDTICLFNSNRINTKGRMMINASSSAFSFSAIGNIFYVLDSNDSFYLRNYDPEEDDFILLQNVFYISTEDKEIDFHNENIDTEKIINNNVYL